MKNRRSGESGFSVLGALLFFALIAGVIQIAILTYDYIIARTQNNGLIAVLMLIVVIMLSAVCTIADVVRRKIMVDRPVKKILSAAERIARGDFSVRLELVHPYGKYDEFDLIMENLNTVAAELGKSEILKTDFISNVSHELKTPLAIIQNYATLLQNENLDLETRKKHAKTLQSASRRLSDLITNILKLNKLENQELKPEIQKFNLTETLTETVLQYEELIETKRLELTCDFEEILITSSPSYLEIVWNNLLSNAVKFTETGGKIGVSLGFDKGKAVVKITDTGCGISPETGSKIFEKFYQGDTSHAQEGNGLGLALVKKVIDLLGGEISVNSELGKGSTFTIVLKGAEHAKQLA
jgi:signal transduction histidine kinase